MTRQIRGKNFELFASETQIRERITELGKALSDNYQDKNPLFIVVLNGAFIFAADLVRTMDFSVDITSVKFASYHSMESSGAVDELIGFQEDVRDRHVILVEDIIDTGNTMHEVKRLLGDFQPASVEIVSMLYKPEALQKPLEVKYYGFKIENRFVVGYGMDWDGYGRNFKDMYWLVE